MGRAARKRRHARTAPPTEGDVSPVYDLAYHHKRLTPHDHSPECESNGDDNASQFLRCLKVELDKIRKDVHDSIDANHRSGNGHD